MEKRGKEEKERKDGEGTIKRRGVRGEFRVPHRLEAVLMQADVQTQLLLTRTLWILLAEGTQEKDDFWFGKESRVMETLL